MKTTVQNWMKRATLMAVTAAAGLGATTAQAHERTDFSIRIGEPAPRCEERATQVWVEPVYRTVSERVWVEPVYKTVCEDVFVPEHVEKTDRVVFEHGRRFTRCEQVLIPAHTERVERRVCVSEGHNECVERRQLVCAGHYETVVDRVERPHDRHWFGRADLDFRFRD